MISARLKPTAFIQFLSLSLLSLAWLNSSQAAVLYYDGFEDYPLETLAGKNAGYYINGIPGELGWLHPWASTGGGAPTVVSGATNFTTGNALRVTATGSNTYATRQLHSTITSGTVYFSIMMDNLNDANGGRFMGMTLQSGGNELLYFGQASDPNRNWGLFSASGPVVNDQIGTGSGNLYSNLTSNLVGPTLMVLRVDFDFFSGGQERLRLYVNPDLASGEPLSATVDAYDNFASIDMIRLGAGFNNTTNASNGIFDEFYVTNSWASIGSFTSAVPEPGRMAMLMLAFVGLTLRRKRSI